MMELDLVVLTPDRDWKAVMEAMLGRADALGVRPLAFTVVYDPMHDPSVVQRAAETLRPYLRAALYALVTVDLEGCGVPNATTSGIESAIRQSLEANGWADRCEVIAVDPELERWLWCDYTQLPAAIGWSPSSLPLGTWLTSRGLMNAAGDVERPKEALRAALRETRTPLSSTLFRTMALRTSVQRCRDPEFRRLVRTLRNWFPP